MKNALFFLFFFCDYLVGQTLSLSKAYESACQNNPTFKASLHKYLAGKEQENQIFSTLLPSVTLIGQKNEYFNNSATYHTSSPYNPATSRYGNDIWELRLTHPLFRPQNFAQYATSKLSTKSTEIEFALRTQEFIIKVAEVYTKVLSTRNSLSLSRQKVQTLYEHMNEVQKRYDLGEATITDLSETQAKYHVALAEETKAIYDEDVASDIFFQTIGQSPTFLETVIETIPVSLPSPSEVDIWIQQAIVGNATVLHKKIAIAIANNTVLSKQAEHLPTVDIVGSSMYTDTKGGINGLAYTSHQNYIGVQLSLPLYQGGNVVSKVKESRERERQTYQEYEEALRNVKSQTLQEFQNVKLGYAQIDSLTMALQASEKSVEATKIGYKLGAKTHIELLQAIEQYYDIHSKLFEAKIFYLLSTLKLKFYVGSLQEKDLSFSVEIPRFGKGLAR